MAVRLPPLAWFTLGAAVAVLVMTNVFLGTSPPAMEGPMAGRAVADSVMAMSAVSAALRHPRVVASLTTFPLGQRMNGVGQMLESLANQTWPLDAVIINFPDYIPRLSAEKLEIPPIVGTWQRQYPWLIVQQTHDRGPATKLLGALEVEKDLDTIIVVLDDDTFYHRDTVLALVSAMLASPIDIMPCFQCEEVTPGWFGSYRWHYQQHEGGCNGFADGYASYAVRPRYFDQTVWDHTLGPEGCKLHDDVWISGCMLTATGVRPHLLRPGFASVAGEAIKQLGGRQQESVFVANRAAAERGEDPQGDCVRHFPFTAGTRPIL